MTHYGRLVILLLYICVLDNKSQSTSLCYAHATHFPAPKPPVSALKPLRFWLAVRALSSQQEGRGFNCRIVWSLPVLLVSPWVSSRFFPTSTQKRAELVDLPAGGSDHESCSRGTAPLLTGSPQRHQRMGHLRRINFSNGTIKVIDAGSWGAGTGLCASLDKL